MPGILIFCDIWIPLIIDAHDSGKPGIPQIEFGIPKNFLGSRIARIPRFIVIFLSIFFFVAVIVFVADRLLH